MKQNRSFGGLSTASLLGGGSLVPAQTSEHDWYESAAIWVCPLH